MRIIGRRQENDARQRCVRQDHPRTRASRLEESVRESVAADMFRPVVSPDSKTDGAWIERASSHSGRVGFVNRGCCFMGIGASISANASSGGSGSHVLGVAS